MAILLHILEPTRKIMLFVDYREGSKDLIKPLQAIGLPVEEVTLDFGDIAFTGRGNDGKPVEIGVEFKTLSELCSALRTERLTGHQLPGMRETFDYSWLLIEGELLFNAKGQLLRKSKFRSRKPKLMEGSLGISEFNKRLLGLHISGGLTPWMTRTRTETLQWLAALYRTWTDKDLDQHDSHIGLYVAPTLVPISDTRQALCMYPGVGMAVSKAAIEKFKSIKRASTASVHEWAELSTVDKSGKSRKFGEKMARRVVDFLEGR